MGVAVKAHECRGLRCEGHDLERPWISVHDVYISSVYTTFRIRRYLRNVSSVRRHGIFVTLD